MSASSEIKIAARRKYLMRLGATVTVRIVAGHLVYYRIHGDPSDRDRVLDFVSFANSVAEDVTP